MSLRFELGRIYDIAAVVTGNRYQPIEPLETFVLATWRLLGGDERATPKLIGKATGLHQDVVRRKLRQLEEKKLLAADAAPKRRGGRGNVVVYRLNLAGAIRKDLGLLFGNGDPEDSASWTGTPAEQIGTESPRLQKSKYDSQSANYDSQSKFVRKPRPAVQVPSAQECRKNTNYRGAHSPGESVRGGNGHNKKPTRAELARAAVTRACKA